MRGNGLYAYDLMAKGDTMSGRALGTLIPSTESIDCRTMYTGPTGTVWCTVTKNIDGIYLLHVVCSIPGDRIPGMTRQLSICVPSKFATQTLRNSLTKTASGCQPMEASSNSTTAKPSGAPDRGRIVAEFPGKSPVPVQGGAESGAVGTQNAPK